MNKLNICIDIDGTITSPYHFIKYLNEICNQSITEEEFTSHKWEDIYDIGEIDLLAKFHGDYIHSYGEAEITEYAREIIKELNLMHNIYFVTARSEILTDITKDWLINNGLSEIDVHLLGSDYKIDKAKELECHIFIEDNPQNALQLADEGMTVLLVDTNYNRETNHDNIIRVSSWIDIKDIIDKNIK